MRAILKLIVFLLSVALVLLVVAFAVLPLPGHAQVLMYHFIDTAERSAVEKNVVSLESFKRQMNFLDGFGYNVISMDEFYKNKTGQRKPGWKEIVITFDDANYTFKDQAFPVLEKYGFSATVFAVSGNVRREIHGSMTEDDLKELGRFDLVTIGSHSKTHPLLSKLSNAEIEEELAGSKRELEKMFGVPVYYLAYPSGDIDRRVLDEAERVGYRLAFTTSYKKLKGLPKGDYSLDRVKITRTSDLLPAYWFKISGIYDGFKRLRNKQI